MQEVESIVDHTLLNKTELFLVYQKAGVSYSTVLNLESFKLAKTGKLPKVGL
jgi:hypothetical protein